MSLPTFHEQLEHLREHAWGIPESRKQLKLHGIVAKMIEESGKKPDSVDTAFKSLANSSHDLRGIKKAIDVERARQQRAYESAFSKPAMAKIVGLAKILKGPVQYLS